MDDERILADYRDQGFVRIRGLLGAEVVAEVRHAIDRYQREVVPTLPAGDYVLEKDRRAVRNLWRMDKHDRFFHALGTRPDVLELVAPLVQGEPELRAVETFNKPSRVGSGVPYHQDNAYFCQTPPDMLTVWIALDGATVPNGAVCYVPGSHARGMLPHGPSGVQGNSIGLTEPPDPATVEEFCATLEPGDAVIHHCQVIHRSEPNRTDRPRCGLLMVYRGRHTRTDPQLEAAYRTALAALERRSGPNVA